MADRILINAHSKKGNLSISKNTFYEIVDDGIIQFKKLNPDCSSFDLDKNIKISIIKGIVHIALNINIDSNINIQDLSLRLQQELGGRLIAFTDQVPFDIQIKVASIKK